MLYKLDNYSGIKKPIQIKINSFKVNDADMKSTKSPIYNSNTQARKTNLFKLHSMYGNAISENIWARSDIANFSTIKSLIQKQNRQF